MKSKAYEIHNDAQGRRGMITRFSGPASTLVSAKKFSGTTLRVGTNLAKGSRGPTRALASSFLAALCWSTLAGAEEYSVTDLGNLGGVINNTTEADGFAINARGQVTGGSYVTSFDYYAFIYSNGVLQDLGTLPGSSSSTGQAINARGEVVGFTSGYANASNISQRAFLYSNGVMQDLGSLGGVNSSASGINDRGQVVGDSQTSTGAFHAFLYSHGVMQDLSSLVGASSDAIGINNNGQIVGSFNTSTGTTHAYLYSNGTMQDLGTLSGYVNSIGNAINAIGEVVGAVCLNISCFKETGQAFLYTHGVMQALGTLGGDNSSANAINDSGEIVGWADTSAGATHAFLYSHGVMVDLNSEIGSATTIYSLTSAEAINDDGQIVANGVEIASGQYVALLLTPDRRQHHRRIGREGTADSSVASKRDDSTFEP
jgi:probable HAF family extracellular repeat protein